MVERRFPTKTRRRFLKTGAVATAVAIAGCGADDEGDNESPDTPDDTETETEQPADDSDDEIGEETVREWSDEYITQYIDREFDPLADAFSQQFETEYRETVPSVIQLFSPFDNTHDAIARQRNALEGQYGIVEAVSDIDIDQQAGVWAAQATLQLETADQQIILELTDDANITGFALPNEYSPPAYADESQFEEHSLEFDHDGVTYPGVLTTPADATNPPCVVLLPGGFGDDENATFGPHQPYRDLAWGLATEGIASFRYSREEFMQTTPFPEVRMDNWIVEPGIRALETVAEDAQIDADGLFALGFATEGTFVPRVANQFGGIAGSVLVDVLAEASPEHYFSRREITIEQPFLTDDEEDYIETVLAEFDDAQDRELGADDNILNIMNGAMWNELEEYDMAETVRTGETPVFVSQPSYDLSEWNEQKHAKWLDVLEEADGTAELYPAVNTSLQEAHGPPVPEMVLFHDNVANVLIEDISEWVHAHS